MSKAKKDIMIKRILKVLVFIVAIMIFGIVLIPSAIYSLFHWLITGKTTVTDWVFGGGISKWATKYFDKIWDY